MNKIELDAIIAKHWKWLCSEDGGERADLSYADLSYANLSSANLRSANLRYANLSYADLSSADLSYANLSSANLRYANLSSADLSYANLSSANLRSANLRSANLRYADLSSANLRSANLRYADLSSANLRYANLSYANLSFAKDGSICRMDFGGWSICIRATYTSIGCQTHENEKWLAWGYRANAIIKMEPRASAWWRMHGDAIKAAIVVVMKKAKQEKQNGKA